jgi:large subunit ribosomal protein L5
MQIPRFVKVIVSMGVGEAKENKKILDAAITDLDQITGQHAVKTKARKSIATFKIRQGQEIGARVTLRGHMMWEFLDRLMNVALPRVKDFRGVNPNAFDGHGNYSLGLTEQIIFPEIDFDKIEKIMGLNIAIVTTARNDKEAKSLLAKMGMPFRK